MSRSEGGGIRLQVFLLLMPVARGLDSPQVYSFLKNRSLESAKFAE